MTEDEAKTKWCPFARYSEENMGSYNRTGRQFVPSKGVDTVGFFKPGEAARPCLCIGSACMAWRSRPDTESHCALMHA